MIPAFDLGQICLYAAGYFCKLVLASLLGDAAVGAPDRTKICIGEFIRFLSVYLGI